jgi:hypothetical protein
MDANVRLLPWKNRYMFGGDARLRYPGEISMMTDGANRGRLLRGTRQLAEYVLGDEGLWRSMYAIAPELPIFKLGNKLSGYTGSLDAALAAKEAAAGKARTPRLARRESAA